jgi:hypothetical protein
MLIKQVYTAAAVAAAAAAIVASRNRDKVGWRGRAIRRRHATMHGIYEQLGPAYFRRAFHMKYESFCKLNNILSSYIIKLARKRGAKPNLMGQGPNGRIAPSIRLGCALRYFAGGSVYDIMIAMGIGRADVSRSIWLVVEAINRCDHLDITFPTDHDSQRKMALAFKEKSSADFNCCVGAVDGILIWIQRPSEEDAAKSACDPQKYFCGRKHKFGLNCQAICDAKGRFLDISLMFPGSTSDVLSFESSTIYRKLQEGLLAPGLCLFGDNAYINQSFMATPYSNVGGGTKDAYNFYHSQLRINIECAFGRFVHRWAILRAAIPLNITIAKTTAMVVALAKLHNYCIDAKDEAGNLIGSDALNISMVGAVPLEPSDDAGVSLPMGLMNGGDHFDDMDRNVRRRREREHGRENGIIVNLPRETLHLLIETKGLTRPPPTRRRH